MIIGDTVVDFSSRVFIISSSVIGCGVAGNTLVVFGVDIIYAVDVCYLLVGCDVDVGDAVGSSVVVAGGYFITTISYRSIYQITYYTLLLLTMYSV